MPEMIRLIQSACIATALVISFSVSTAFAEHERDNHRRYDDHDDHRGHPPGHDRNKRKYKHRHDHTHTYSHSHPHGRNHDSREHGHRHYSRHDHDDHHSDGYSQDDNYVGTSESGAPVVTKPVKPPKPPTPPTPWKVMKSFKPIYFTVTDKQMIKRYYRHTRRRAELLAPSAFPPGTEGRVKRGVILPPGVGIKNPRSKLDSKLGPLPSGYRYGLLGRLVIIYNKKTRVVTDYYKVKM